MQPPDTLYVITSGVISIQSNLCAHITQYKQKWFLFFFIERKKGLLNVRIIKCKLLQQWFLWSMWILVEIWCRFLCCCKIKENGLHNFYLLLYYYMYYLFVWKIDDSQLNATIIQICLVICNKIWVWNDMTVLVDQISIS